MKNLIKALQILLKYNEDLKYPTRCEHDTLYIHGIDPVIVSKDDLEELEEIGFRAEGNYFISYTYGSC